MALCYCMWCTVLSSSVSMNESRCTTATTAGTGKREQCPCRSLTDPPLQRQPRVDGSNE